MTDDLLRRPSSYAELAADFIRLLITLSIIAGAIWWGPLAAALFLLLLGGVVLSRMAGAHPIFDAVYGISILAAAWSSVLNLYEAISWWDTAMHWLATGTVAPMVYLLLGRLHMLPEADPSASGRARWGVVVVTVSLGLALSVVWEFAEWAGHKFIEEAIQVGYEDSLGDIAAGGVGAAAAGVILAFRGLSRRNTSVLTYAH